MMIVDLEATCWERDPKEPPSNQIGEIIEIGMVILDLSTLEIEKPLPRIMVRPIATTVSNFCTRLTGITQQDVDQGMSLEAAFILLREAGSKKMPWGSWGNYDLWKIDEEAGRKGLKYPFLARHINIKLLHGIMRGHRKEMGLGAAVSDMGLKFEGDPHCGFDDAVNIARVTAELLGSIGERGKTGVRDS
jgi:inhibitor of KinA sporulation pathway (predicted exonuclease)